MEAGAHLVSFLEVFTYTILHNPAAVFIAPPYTPFIHTFDSVKLKRGP